MNTIKQWTITITLAAVACIILETLTLGKKFEKIIQFVLGTFMLCAILFPLKTTLKNISYNLKDKDSSFFDVNEKFKDKVSEQVQMNSKKNIKKIIIDTLKEKNINVKKVELFMDKKEDNCISINKADIYLNENDKEKKEEVIKTIEKNLGIKTVVIFGSD